MTLEGVGAEVAGHALDVAQSGDDAAVPAAGPVADLAAAPPAAPLPPAAPVPDGPPVGHAGGFVRFAADVVVPINDAAPGDRPSTIVCYRSGTFYAYCRHCDHGVRCKVSRSGANAKTKRGRPLGFLHWWLLRARHHGSAADHTLDVFASRADRRAARDALKTVPGAAGLFEREKRRNSDSESEPQSP